MNMQEVLIANEKYSLSMSVAKQQLRFILTVFGTPNHKQLYQAFITSIQTHVQLSRYFQSVHDLACHLRTPQNLQVHLQTKQIYIFLNLSTKKAKKVQISKIHLIPLQEDLQAQLRHIIDRCGQKSQLDQTEIINNMRTMTKILNVVVKSQKEKSRATETHYEISDDSESVVPNVFPSPECLLKNKVTLKKQNPIQTIQINKLEPKHIDQLLKIEKKIEQINNKYVNLDQLQQVISKMGIFGQTIQTIFERISKVQINIQQNLQLEQIKNKRIKAEQWVDPECYYFLALNYSGRIITNASSGPKMVLGKKKPQKYKSFCVCFTKIQAFSGVGVVDTQYRTRFDWSNLDHLIIYGSGGLCWIGSVQFGPTTKGYQAGQIIQVRIDYTEGTIQWTVDGQIRHIAQSPLLKNEAINWVPIIYFGQNLDSVMILK